MMRKTNKVESNIGIIIGGVLLIIGAFLGPLDDVLYATCFGVLLLSSIVNFHTVRLWLDIGKEIFRRDIRKWWALMFLINIAFLIFSFCISAIEVMMTVFGIINILFIVPYTLYVLIKKLIKKRF
ncbi:hypothetical protein E0494_08480 [Marinilabiliaceae bacterium JC040]|nr:hypothetical protein [Marinilabiliaceae bacterium JC040]